MGHGTLTMPDDTKQEPGRISPTGGRVPPSNLDAEGAIISAMLIDKSRIDVLVESGFRPEHCYSDANRRIVEAIFDLNLEGADVDPVTVAAYLRDRGRLGQIGGSPYLGQLVEATPAIANAEEHGRLVTECFRRRRAIQICQIAVATGYEPMESTQSYLETIETEVSELAHAKAVVKLEPVGTIASREVTRMADAVRLGHSTLGLQTGFGDLDKLTGGLYPGDLTIVAARPGMGKTAFLTSLLMNVTHATLGQPSNIAAAMFSLEMPRSQIGVRFAAHEARLPMNRVRTSTLSREEWTKLIEVCGSLSRVPLWIDDTAELGLLELKSMVRKLKREIRSGAHSVKAERLGIVGVDYLQLMRGIGRKGGSREEEVASLSRGLKALAKEEEVPIIALAQLNRNVEKNRDKRPSLADLRESGSIEQDADNVWFIYREAYYDKTVNPKEAEVIIGKQRSGPTGTVGLVFEGEPMRFYSAAKQEDWDPSVDDDYYGGN